MERACYLCRWVNKDNLTCSNVNNSVLFMTSERVNSERVNICTYPKWRLFEPKDEPIEEPLVAYIGIDEEFPCTSERQLAQSDG